MKRHVALLTLMSVIALLVLPIAPALAQSPVYTQTIGDAVTGDNPLQNQSGPQNACKSNQCRFPDDGADSYTAELWERPMNQQQDLFYPAFDITQAQLGSDSEWYYFKINVYGGNEPYPFYGWEIGTNGDPRGGLFIRADEPQKKNSSYGSQSLIAWHDGNNTVGAGTTNAPDGPGNTDGFEDKVFDQSGSNVQVRASGSVIEFAARKSFVHQYVSPSNISHRGWALKGGVNDPTKLYGHDVYDRSQAGSPYPYLNQAGAPDSGTANNAKSGNVNPFYPTGNIYEIDNTQWLTIIQPDPVIDIEKTGDRTQTALNETVTYTLTVTNPGPEDLKNVVVADNRCDGANPRTRLSGDTNNDNILQRTETWTYRCTRLITNADVTAGSVLNTATADGVGVTSNKPAHDQDDFNVTVNPLPTPVIDIEKLGDRTQTALNETVTYTLTVTNPGPEDLKDVVVADNRCDGSNPRTKISGDTNNDNILQRTETWTYRCTRLITNADVTAGSVLNTATADGVGVTSNKPAHDQDDFNVTVNPLPTPVIDLEKTGDRSVATVGDTINYTFEVRNRNPQTGAPGPEVLRNINLKDDKCSTPVFQGGDTNSNQRLEVGEVWTYKCSRVLSSADVGQFKNIADVEGTGVTSGKKATDIDDFTVTVNPQGSNPQIALDKTSDKQNYKVGEKVQYTFTVTNPNPAVPLKNVTLSDQVPQKCDSTPTGPTKNNSDSDDLLENGEQWIYKCEHTVTSTDETAGKIDNTATARGNSNIDNTPVQATDSHTVFVTKDVAPQITIEKSGPQTANRGDEITYTMKVSIPVNRPLTNVTVTDPKCDSTPVLVSRSGGDQDDVLEFGEVWTYNCKHRITALDADPLPNTAVATGRDDKGNEVRDDDDHLVDILPGPPTPAIDIEKDGPARAQIGDTITYRLAVSIPIDRPLTNVVVTDPRCDDDPELVSKTGGDTDDTLEFGEVWNYRCSHRVRASDPNPLPNTATATGVDEAGTQVEDQDSHLVDLIAPADIRIVKTGPQSVNVGDSILYTLEVSIPVDHPLTNVEVKDPRCDNAPTLDDKRGGDNDNTLEFGETWVYHCSHVATENEVGTLPNVATATGEDEAGDRVRDTDPHNVTVQAVLGEQITRPDNPNSGILPFTGSSSMPLIAMAIGMLLTGAAALGISRKREEGTTE